ncbi:hypothetical protein F66182_7801 [Fusarium sp. NRRL 66182]|nr:hypothetical protein F66182_7801 [Fusarium sp. NRRL 66182]
MAPESSTQTNHDHYAPVPNPAIPPAAQPSSPTHPYSQQSSFQQDPRTYGQPFSPYQQQQPAYAPPQQPWTPPRVAESKAWMITKLTLHGLDILTCIIGLGLTIALTRVGLLGLVALGACPLFVVALVWDIAELITRKVRKFEAGIHPGAHVAISLLIWLGAGALGGLESTLSAYTFDYLDRDCEYDSEEQTYECTTTDKYTSKRAMFIALSVMTCMVWLWHFILFIGACIDTQKRNAAMKRPVTMVFGGPAYWGPGAQGFQQVPQYYGPPQGQNIPMQNWAAPQDGNGKEAVTTAQPVAGRYA